MKNTTPFKKEFFKLSLVAVVLFGASCDSPKNQDTKEIATEHNEAKFDSTNNEKDAKFLVNVAEINLEEIKLGQLAKQMGRTERVKELGQMMDEAHSKCMSSLATLAAAKSITIPTTPTDNTLSAYKDLNNKSGADFDLAYCDMMVAGHKGAIVMFEKASAESTDADIRQWASETLPELRKHLDHAMTCQKECGKNKATASN
jgi:putative membrane protein